MQSELLLEIAVKVQVLIQLFMPWKFN